MSSIYPPRMRGASAGAAGRRGLAPKPAAGDQLKTLRGDGTWQLSAEGGQGYKGTWNASTNTPTLIDGTGTAGDAYNVQTAASRDLGSGSIAYAVGDWVVYNGTIWQKRTLAERWDSVTVAAISAAGNTDFTIAAGVRNSSCGVSVGAGSAVYIATLSLLATNAVAGAQAVLQVAMPASLNPTLEIRNLTSGGTLLGTLYGHPTEARNWTVRLRFDGTNWAAPGITPANLRSASERLLQESLATRATAPAIYFDGSTAGRKALATLGTAGALGTLPVTFLKRVKVPATNPSAVRGLFTVGSSNATANAVRTFSSELRTNGDLWFTLFGATTSDYNRATLSGWRSAVSGVWATLAIVKPATGNPTLYSQGVAQSPTLSDSGGATTPPTWQGSITSTYLLDGLVASSEAWDGFASPLIIVLGEMTAAEILEHAQTGLLPPWCVAFTGSAVNLHTNNYSFETDTASPPAGWTHAGNQVATAVADGTAPQGSNVAEIVASGAGSWSANAFYQATASNSRKGGAYYRLDFWAKSISGSTSLRIRATPNDSTLISGSLDQTITTDWVRYSLIYRALTDGQHTIAFYLAAAGTVRLDAIELRQLGPVIKPVEQPGCPVSYDSGDNGIPLVNTSGVTSVGPKPAQVVIQGNAMTADGFMLLDQIIAPAGYELVAFYALQSGTSAAALTVKETSSGGTTVASGNLSATATRVGLTVSNGLLAAGKKIHIAGITAAAVTVTPCAVFRIAA